MRWPNRGCWPNGGFAPQASVSPLRSKASVSRARSSALLLPGRGGASSSRTHRARCALAHERGRTPKCAAHPRPGRSSVKPAAEKSSSNASAKDPPSSRMVAKLVASTQENSRSSLRRSHCSAAASAFSETLQNLDPRGALEGVEERHGGGVPGASAQEGPCLTAHVVRRDQTFVRVGAQKRRCLLVPRIALVGERDPEARVDEDQELDELEGPYRVESMSAGSKAAEPVSESNGSSASGGSGASPSRT